MGLFDVFIQTSIDSYLIRDTPCFVSNLHLFMFCLFRPCSLLMSSRKGDKADSQPLFTVDDFKVRGFAS